MRCQLVPLHDHTCSGVPGGNAVSERIAPVAGSWARQPLTFHGGVVPVMVRCVHTVPFQSCSSVLVNELITNVVTWRTGSNASR